MKYIKYYKESQSQYERIQSIQWAIMHENLPKEDFTKHEINILDDVHNKFYKYYINRNGGSSYTLYDIDPKNKYGETEIVVYKYYDERFLIYYEYPEIKNLSHELYLCDGFQGVLNFFNDFNS